MPLSFNPFNNRISFIPDQSSVPGPPGFDGRDGSDGEDGVDGIDGVDGRDGIDGVDGIDGRDGRRGSSLLHGFGEPSDQEGYPMTSTSTSQTGSSMDLKHPLGQMVCI